MFDIALHTGSEHPDLLWILVPSILSFVAGLGASAYADRLRRLVPARDDATAE